MSDLKSLLERVEKATKPDNSLDIAIEIALFTPDQRHLSVCANDAGTKLIYERRGVGEDTYWAADVTLNANSRKAAAALLRSLIAQQEASPNVKGE